MVLFVFVSGNFCNKAKAAEEINIAPIWSIEKTFQLPESATYHPDSQTIYVSNIVKYAKDGSGFISKISGDGKVLSLKWISGLNSPTGLAVYQDLLYAVDMDELVVIDLIKEKIINKIKAPQSKKLPLLNDVAISPSGKVFVSGSQSRKLYTIKDDQLVVFVDDQERLLKANGLLVDNGELIHGGQFWNRFTMKDGALISLSKKPTPSSKLFDFDGITHDGKGGYIVTVIDDGRLWRITKEGKTTPLSEEAINGIDIHFDIESQRLFVPRVGGGLTVFQISSNTRLK